MTERALLAEDRLVDKLVAESLRAEVRTHERRIAKAHEPELATLVQREELRERGL